MRSAVLFALFFIFFTSLSHADSLHCEFGFFGTTIVISETELYSPQKVGEYTQVNYQGTAPRKLKNLDLIANGENLFHFQLDEGFGDQNLFIVVSKKQINEKYFAAFIENPQTPSLKRLQGQCEFQ